MRAAAGARLPAPEQVPTLSMPAHHRLGRDNRQMLAPTGAEAAGQHPQQLVPEAQASTWPGASGAGQHSELMVQQQVLEHEVLAWANAGQDGRQEQPDEFKHVLSIADLRRARVLPPDTHTRSAPWVRPAAFSTACVDTFRCSAANSRLTRLRLPNSASRSHSSSM